RSARFSKSSSIPTACGRSSLDGVTIPAFSLRTRSKIGPANVIRSFLVAVSAILSLDNSNSRAVFSQCIDDHRAEFLRPDMFFRLPANSLSRLHRHHLLWRSMEPLDERRDHKKQNCCPDQNPGDDQKDMRQNGRIRDKLSGDHTCYV